MEFKDAIKYIDESNRAFDSGNIDDALRISGEGLAMADNDWIASVNSGNPDHEQFWAAADLAQIHCMLLIRAGEFDQAFSVAAMMICQVIERDISPIGHEDGMMMLLLVVAHASTEYCRYMADDPSIDESSKIHAMMVAIETNSMLYAAYQKWHKGLAPDLAQFFYNQVKASLDEQLVIYPDIEIDGRTIHPDDISQTIGDAIGRAMAIGLFNITE